MAILPDYTSGLISLAKGSVTVTGTGTMFEAAAFKAGDVLLIQNLIAVIANVDSNTKLTLMVPWTGTSLVNAPYRLRRTPDGTTVSGRTTTLIEMLGNGVLSSIAELPVQDGSLLVGNAAGGYSHVNIDDIGVDDPKGNLKALSGVSSAADTLAYFTGEGEAGVTKLTALARNVLAAANGGAAYDALGEIPNGSLRDGLKTNGGSPINDLNTITENGFYRVAANSSNAPETASMVLLHISWSANQARQIAFRHSNNAIYERANIAGTWTAWFRIYSANNLLANVSQLNGVPTGGVIQRGSNANGEFVRLADGTQICWAEKTVSATNMQSGSGIYITNSTEEAFWTFPAIFAGYPSFSGVSLSGAYGLTVVGRNVRNDSVFVGLSTPISRTSLVVICSAIGRWF